MIMILLTYYYMNIVESTLGGSWCAKARHAKILQICFFFISIQNLTTTTATTVYRRYTVPHGRVGLL